MKTGYTFGRQVKKYIEYEIYEQRLCSLSRRTEICYGVRGKYSYMKQSQD